jgi:enoyl-CoA hydratase
MWGYDTVGTWCGFGCEGAAGRMAIEKELYLGLSERWRNIPKPTIAEVQGKVIAGGLMLVWPCDLIVASEDAQFADNTVAMGIAGAEFFNHPWELGARKAKEMLFTCRGSPDSPWSWPARSPSSRCSRCAWPRRR